MVLIVWRTPINQPYRIVFIYNLLNILKYNFL